MKAAVLDGFLRKDPAAIAALFSEQAELLGPDGRAITGRSAIEARIAEVLPRVQAYSIGSARSHAAGELAYDRETFHLTMAAADGAEPRTIIGHHLVILERQRDRSWKVVLSGWWVPAPADEAGMHH